MRDPVQVEEWVTVARLTRARGRRGELSAVSLSSHHERFEKLREVALVGAEAFPDESRRYVVEEVWEHGPRLIFKLEGVDSISDAEELRGAEVRIPPEERFELPEGEYYHSDLVGCEVFTMEGGEPVGLVAEFLEQGGNGILRVERSGDGREVLIPFVKEICSEIDVGNKRIGVRLPEGLLDLNG